jgi:O-antigen/teichoic acid export membrane protein
MSALKKLAGDAVLYGLPSIVGRLLFWLLGSLHTRVFTAQETLTENGQLYVWLVPLQIIFTFGMETAFFRYGSKKENQKDAFNSILSFILVLGFCLCAILVIFAKTISGYLNLPGAENMIRLMAIILWVDAITAIAFVKIRANNKAKKFAGIKMASILITIALNLFYLVFCQLVSTKGFMPAFKGFTSYIYDPAHGPDYIIWANYIASVLTLLFLAKEYTSFRFKWDWEDLKPKINYAYPLMIMGLAGAINLTADRLLIRDFLPQNFYPEFKNTDQAFSVYAQVYKLSIFMTLVVQAYRYAADPLFFSKMGNKNSPSLMAFSTEWFTIACIILWVGVSLNLSWIQLFLGENYRAFMYIVPILLLANLFIGLYGNVSIWFKLTDKTHFGSYVTVITMALTIVLNMVFIPKFGFLACAITFVISSFGMVAAAYILGQKHYKVDYDVKSLGLYLLGACLVIFVLFPLKASNVWFGFAFNNLVFILFLATILWHQFKIKKVDFSQKF